jgi:hypothetical protein
MIASIDHKGAGRLTREQHRVRGRRQREPQKTAGGKCLPYQLFAASVS